MGWENLPQEVLLQILREIHATHYHGLLQCQLTCRSWKQPSQLLLYSTLTLQSPSKAYAAINNISLNQLNNSVKKVLFEKRLARSPAIEHILPLFFKTCPYITQIETNDAKDESFWVKLLLECDKGTLTKVQQVPMVQLSRDSAIKIHGYVTMKLSSTLNTVQIWDWPQSTPMFRHSPVASNLPRFPNLRRLSVYVCGIYNAANIAILIQDCKKLKMLSIVNHPYRRVAYSQRGTDQDLPLPKPIIGLKVIQTDMITVTSNLIRQLMYAFPDLTTLTLNSTAEVDFSPETEVDEGTNFIYRMQREGYSIQPSTWVDFISYVYKNIHCFNLSLLFIPNSKEVILNSIQTPKFKDHGGQLRIMYVRCSADSIILEPYVGISSDDNSIKIIYETRRTYQSNGDDMFSLPHMDLIESLVGSKIKNLQISISPVTHFCDEDSPLYALASGYFLDHIFEHCTELITLTVNSAHLIECDPDYIINNSITTLQLIECLVCPSILTQISQRLPYLSDVVICYTYFVSTAGLVIESNKCLSIDLPYTTIQNLSIEWFDRLHGICDGFHLKIKKSNETVYYIGKIPTEFNKSTKSIYQASLNRNTSLSLRIHCVDLKALFLESRSFGIDIVFKNNDDFRFKFVEELNLL